MITRALSYISLATLLIIASLFSITTSVNAANVSWDGEGADNNFSTAANWAGDAVPVDGDSITFDVTSLSADETLNNDIVGLDLVGITNTGTNVSYYDYTISGAAFTVEGSIDGGTIGLNIDTDVTISNSTVLAGTVSFAGDNILTLAADVTVNGNTFIGADIVGASNMLVAANGLLSLSGVNTWTGNLTIQADGYVNAFPGGLGNSANVITINDEGAIAFCGFYGASVDNPISIAGNGGQYDTGAITAVGFCGGGAGSTGPVPAANVILNGDITYTGNTTVYTAGQLEFRGATAVGAYTTTIGSGQPGTLVLAYGTNATSTPNGTYKSAVNETIYSDSQPANPISIEYNNRVIVTGTRGDVTIGAGELKGTGTVGNVNMSGGILAPGLSPGVLNTGNLLFTGGTLEIELGGTTPGNTSTNHDQLNVTGSVDLGSTTTLDISHWNGFRGGLNNQFVIISNDGSDAVSGTFQGLADGATVTVDGITYTISYDGGDGNDVVLTTSGVAATASAPDTGFAQLSNPLVVTVLSILSVIALSVVYKKFAK